MGIPKDPLTYRSVEMNRFYGNPYQSYLVTTQLPWKVGVSSSDVS